MSQQVILDDESHLSYGKRADDVMKELTGNENPRKQPKDYATYVIECEGYDDAAYGTEDKFLSDWEYWATTEHFTQRYDPPNWAWAAYYADRVFYIGQTSCLFDRLLDHIECPEKTSIVNCVFDPMRVERVEWCESKKESKQLEEKLADEYSNRGKGWFAYYA
jgi:hypothetical protein